MELAQSLRHYGYVAGGEGIAEWGCGGATRGSAKVLLGCMGILLLTQDGREACFKVTRMRCWRITTMRLVNIKIILSILIDEISNCYNL